MMFVQRGIEVALNIRAADGGEDGRISWEGFVDKTDFLPKKLTMFQNKATSMTALGYADEVQNSAKTALKPKVEQVLDENGAYVVFTTQELNTQAKQARIEAIRAVLNGYGKVCDS